MDDFSDKEDLGDKLEGYIKRFRGKVRLEAGSEYKSSDCAFFNAGL